MFHLSFCWFQILAYVSQVHKVLILEGVVDNDTMTLEQVCSFLTPLNTTWLLCAVLNKFSMWKGDSIGGVTCIARNASCASISQSFNSLISNPIALSDVHLFCICVIALGSVRISVYSANLVLFFSNHLYRIYCYTHVWLIIEFANYRLWTFQKFYLCILGATLMYFVE